MELQSASNGCGLSESVVPHVHLTVLRWSRSLCGGSFLQNSQLGCASSIKKSARQYRGIDIANLYRFNNLSICWGLACISASRCLGIMGHRAAPYASAALTRVLSNAGSDLRYEALVALGYLGPEAAPEAATAVAERATTDEDARLRRQALLTLTMFGPDAAQPAGGIHESWGHWWCFCSFWWQELRDLLVGDFSMCWALFIFGRCGDCKGLPGRGHWCAGPVGTPCTPDSMNHFWWTLGVPDFDIPFYHFFGISLVILRILFLSIIRRRQISRFVLYSGLNQAFYPLQFEALASGNQGIESSIHVKIGRCFNAWPRFLPWSAWKRWVQRWMETLQGLPWRRLSTCVGWLVRCLGRDEIWWKLLNLRDLIVACLSSKTAGQHTSTRISRGFQWFPNIFWTFVSKHSTFLKSVSAHFSPTSDPQVLASGSAEMRRFAMETIAVIGNSVASHCSKAVAHHLRPLPGSWLATGGWLGGWLVGWKLLEMELRTKNHRVWFLSHVSPFWVQYGRSQLGGLC